MTDMPPYVRLANLLSKVDQEVPGQQSCDDKKSHGNRWSAEHFPEDPNIFTELKKRLIGGKCEECEVVCTNLHCFLQCALNQAILLGVGDDTKSCSAGAIYLHDSVYDELVMSASIGFPFNDSLTSDNIDNLVEALAQDLCDIHNPPNEDAIKKLKATIQLYNNINRQIYVEEILGPRIGQVNIRRDPWVREELRGVYNGIPKDETRPRDCNKFLIGVAYYKPGKGITGQLFHPEEGPKLERLFVEDAIFIGDFTTELGQINVNTNLQTHLSEELLYKRTVVYRERGEMGAGRQVRAGTYEGMQFPDSQFIGPFLGTVLKFNGEHLGVLKVEKHQLSKVKINTGKLKDMIVTAKPFKGSGTADFLVFSYALAGILYILKHHIGVDLSDGWTSHWSNPNKCNHNLRCDNGVTQGLT